MRSASYLTNAARLRRWFSALLAVGVVSAMTLFVRRDLCRVSWSDPGSGAPGDGRSLRDLVLPRDFEHGQPVAAIHHRRHRSR